MAFMTNDTTLIFRKFASVTVGSVDHKQKAPSLGLFSIHSPHQPIDQITNDDCAVLSLTASNVALMAMSPSVTSGAAAVQVTFG